MPKIVLKHKSPEYADDTEQIALQICEMPGCERHGEHKAPKHRGLNEYYIFCPDHIREYNKAWNFFAGMSNTEVQDHIYSSFYGDRPTWKAHEKFSEEDLYRSARNEYYFGDPPSQQNSQEQTKRDFQGYANTPEYEAMAIMGLSPPVTLDEIKTTYKKLAKKHHPDLNKDNPKAEELLKEINMAYTILKLAFEEYKNLPEQKI